MARSPWGERSCRRVLDSRGASTVARGNARSCGASTVARGKCQSPRIGHKPAESARSPRGLEAIVGNQLREAGAWTFFSGTCCCPARGFNNHPRHPPPSVDQRRFPERRRAKLTPGPPPDSVAAKGQPRRSLPPRWLRRRRGRCWRLRSDRPTSGGRSGDGDDLGSGGVRLRARGTKTGSAGSARAERSPAPRVRAAPPHPLRGPFPSANDQGKTETRESLRKPGSNQKRYAARTNPAQSCHEPPRITRFEPIGSPVHSRRSQHVVQAPGICGFSSHRVGLAAAILAVHAISSSLLYRAW